MGGGGVEIMKSSADNIGESKKSYVLYGGDYVNAPLSQKKSSAYPQHGYKTWPVPYK